MIKDSDINTFIDSLSSHLRVLINRISEKETWSTDDHDDVRKLINELSGLLDRTDEKLLINASHLLLSNSAYFSLPRFLRFFAIMSAKNPEMVQQILNPMNAQLIPDGPIFLSTVINRLRYVVQSVLVKEIFEPETVERIYQSVLAHEKKKKELAGIDSIDLSGDMPYETKAGTHIPSTEKAQVIPDSEPLIEPEVEPEIAPPLPTANKDGESILVEKIKSKSEGKTASITKKKTIGESIRGEDVFSIIQDITGKSLNSDQEN
jgi:hypothetical protein